MQEGIFSSKEAAEVVLLLSMPIHYQSLVVECTTRCNARCAICYQEAGPKGSDGMGEARMDTKLIKRCIREASIIETIGPRFHIAGGECFLYPDDTYEILKTAKEAGFSIITTTTNAFWAASPEKAREVCGYLRESGLFSMEVSWDYWHREYVPAEAINNCLLACKEAEIETTLRLLTTKNHGMDEAVSFLSPEAAQSASRITSGPVFATGRAKANLDKDEFYYSRAPLQSSCHSMLNLTINALGDVSPCCAGFDHSGQYRIGNVADEPLETIVARINGDPIMRRLVFSGPSVFLPMLEEAGYPLGEDFYGICHLCYSIFSNAEYTEAISRAFERRKREALISAADRLEALERLGKEAV